MEALEVVICLSTLYFIFFQFMLLMLAASTVHWLYAGVVTFLPNIFKPIEKVFTCAEIAVEVEFT